MRVHARLIVSAFALGAVSLTASASNNLIGFNFTTAAAGTPDPQNWNRISAADGTLNNAMDDTGAATNVNFSWGGGATGGFVFLSTSTLAADATPQHDYDLSGMTGYGFRSNGEFFMNVSGLDANTPYEYWFVGYRGGSNIDNLVRVSDGDTIDAFSFSQNIALADNDGRFLVNDTNANSSMNWNDLSFVTNSSSSGEITINWSVQSQTPVIGAFALRVVPTPGAGAVLAIGALGLTRRRR